MKFCKRDESAGGEQVPGGACGDFEHGTAQKVYPFSECTCGAVTHSTRTPVFQRGRTILRGCGESLCESR